MAKKNEIAKVDTATIQPVEQIESLILTIRGKQVILDRDLARLYGVETKRLNQQVQRNLERFPGDFMFQLNKEEAESLRSQFVMLNDGSDNLKSQFATSSFKVTICNHRRRKHLITNCDDINIVPSMT